MTYCLAIKVNDGLVFASDSRTNAGMDHISSYSKMYTFNVAGDRTFVLLSSGNLATTQGVVNHIDRELKSGKSKTGIHLCEQMFDAADYVGHLSRQIQGRDQGAQQQEAVSLDASFILGGQIGQQEPDLYLIYPEGNYISVSPTKPYFQIGETKYGKPILDRIVENDTSLEDAARCALVSLDSTMRSNLSVGPPFELAIYHKGDFDLAHHLTLDVDNPLYLDMTQGWSDGLRNAFTCLPRFDWE